MMTLFDFIYYIGSGVAFIMGAIGLYDANNKLPKEEQSKAGVIVCSLFCASLSWAVPIWWIGFEIYKRLGNIDDVYKHYPVVIEENQQLKELLISAKDIIEWYSTESGYIDLPTKDLLTKINNAIGEKR